MYGKAIFFGNISVIGTVSYNMKFCSYLKKIKHGSCSEIEMRYKEN